MTEQTVLFAGEPPGLLPLLEEVVQKVIPRTRIARSNSLGETLARVSEGGFDLLVMDAVHANGGFRDLMARIRHRGVDAPSVIVTGVESDAAGESLVREGAQDYLLQGCFDRALLARTIRHITACRCLASAVAESEARYHRLLGSVTDYIYTVVIENGRAVSSHHSPGCLAVTGYSSDEYDADQYLWYRMVHDEDRPAVLDMTKRVLAGKNPPPLEHRIIHRDGSIRWVRNTPVPRLDPDGQLVSYDGLISDITARKQAEQRLKHVSYYDSLTDLPNRERLRDRLRQELVRARRHGRVLAVMVLDIDRFKEINETLGHAAGDVLLQAVAERLVVCIREDDTVARPGGDEFIMLFADLGAAQDASTVAQKVQEVFGRPFAVGGQEYFITASIGISLFPDHGTDADTLIKNAEAALYQAKAGGRNTYQFYLEARHAGAHKKLSLENAMRRAIEREEFTIHYQPLIDLASGRTTGVEALVRWQHPELGLLHPLEFIPLAEDTGLIIPLGAWILTRACLQAREWTLSGHPPLRLSVNISLRQFVQNTVKDTVMRAIDCAQLDPGLLELELTESMVMNDAETTIASLRDLRSLGIHLTLDDFGTGYSSLSRLKDLPLSTLKLDRSFVSAVTRDRSNAAISKAIVALSHTLDLRVIAEGVETTDQLEFLRGLGCDEAQGYLFSRPVPARELELFMADAERDPHGGTLRGWRDLPGPAGPRGCDG